MKKLVIIISLLISHITLLAQDDQLKTIFNATTEIRGFATFDMKVSSWHEETALFLGGHGGIIINRHIMCAVGGYGVTTSHHFINSSGEELKLHGGYGGFLVGYIFHPVEVIHITTPLFVGIGGADVVEASSLNISDGPRRSVERSAYFVIEPGVEAEVNVTHFFRIGLSMGYRLVRGSKLPLSGVSNMDLSSWTAGVSFKFGKF